MDFGNNILRRLGFLRPNQEAVSPFLNPSEVQTPYRDTPLDVNPSGDSVSLSPEALQALSEPQLEEENNNFLFPPDKLDPIISFSDEPGRSYEGLILFNRNITENDLNEQLRKVGISLDGYVPATDKGNSLGLFSGYSKPQLEQLAKLSSVSEILGHFPE